MTCLMSSAIQFPNTSPYIFYKIYTSLDVSDILTRNSREHCALFSHFALAYTYVITFLSVIMQNLLIWAIIVEIRQSSFMKRPVRSKDFAKRRRFRLCIISLTYGVLYILLTRKPIHALVCRPIHVRY